MQLGMIGLGRMGANLVRRLVQSGHECVVYDVVPAAAHALAQEQRVIAADSPADLVHRLASPRVVWMMVPAAAVDATIKGLLPALAAGDVLIDGGNSYYVDDLARAQALAAKGIHYLDVGTSGGVRGLERGYCLMIGGDAATVERLDPIFATLAPGVGDLARTPGRDETGSTAERGYLHCGPSGAGHFVKMVHNGIEYGMMAAYAEGFAILERAGIGRHAQAADAETTPLRHAERYRYDFALEDVAEVWRRGSVVSSWLLDLMAQALHEDPALTGFTGHVADSGEGRWTIQAAVDAAVPAPVLTAALYARFSSRGNADFQNRLLSAMRYGFGGHVEQAPQAQGQEVTGHDGG